MVFEREITFTVVTLLGIVEFDTFTEAYDVFLKHEGAAKLKMTTRQTFAEK